MARKSIINLIEVSEIRDASRSCRIFCFRGSNLGNPERKLFCKDVIKIPFFSQPKTQLKVT